MFFSDFVNNYSNISFIFSSLYGSSIVKHGLLSLFQTSDVIVSHSAIRSPDWKSGISNVELYRSKW